jgi:hypothetical protein
MITVYITDIENGKLGECQEFSFDDRGEEYTEFCEGYWRCTSIVSLDQWSEMSTRDKKFSNYSLAWEEVDEDVE